MGKAGAPAGGTPAPLIDAEAKRLARAEVDRIAATVRASGFDLAAKGAAGNAQLAAAALVLAFRDELLDRLDEVGKALIDEGVQSSVSVGGTPTAAYRLIGELAGRTESGTRYAFGRAVAGRPGRARAGEQPDQT